MENICRINISDENRASMLRAAMLLGGIKCGGGGKILISDSIPSELHDTDAIILITDAADAPDADIPTTVVRPPICFDEVIAAVEEMRERLDGERNDAPAKPSPDGAQLTVRDGCIIYKGKTVRLTEQEFSLFEYLRAREGKTVTRRELREALWCDADEGTNVTDVYISYLRRKLKPVFGEGVLLTVRGCGYILKLG